ncbi:MAG: SH3 domain-containing protein [Desulfatitalea sp.]
MRFFTIATTMVTLLFMAAAGVDAAERMAVIADTANVRSGPGTKHEQLWQVEKYYPVLVVEKKSGWSRIKDFEGDEGWIEGSLLGKIATVIVRVPRGNVRSGPGTEFDTTINATKGIPFKVLQTKGQWLQVEHADGDTGWILKTLVW